MKCLYMFMLLLWTLLPWTNGTPLLPTEGNQTTSTELTWTENTQRRNMEEDATKVRNRSFEIMDKWGKNEGGSWAAVLTDCSPGGYFMMKKLKSDDDIGDLIWIQTVMDDCTVFTDLPDLMAFRNTIKTGELWKYDLIMVEISITNSDFGNQTIDHNLRLLKSSQQSDYIFLPLQVEHFVKIRQFLDHKLLYDNRTLKTASVGVTLSCDKPIVLTEDNLVYDLLTAHIAKLNSYNMHFMEQHYAMEAEEELDSVCLSFVVDSKYRRPGVPFELKHCCKSAHLSMFDKEEQRATEGETVQKFVCSAPADIMHLIRRWAVTLAAIFLFVLPLFIVFFPGKPEPYKVLKRKRRLGRINAFRKSTAEEPDDAETPNNVDEETDHSNDDEKLAEILNLGDLLKKQDSGATADNNDDGDENIESLPAIVTEGKDFQNDLPDRLYLDSDPEFHLNIKIVTSYLMLFHIDSHVLTVLRRIFILYTTCLVIGIGNFTYMYYYIFLLDDPMIQFVDDYIWAPIFIMVFGKSALVDTNDHLIKTRKYYFFVYILPAFCTVSIFGLLSPLLLRKQTVAKTLYCDGGLKFFGDPFPETLYERDQILKTPKPSKKWTYEDLLYRSMRARIRNLRNPKFWKLLWERWIFRGCDWLEQRIKDENKKSILKYALLPFWFLLCLVLVSLYVIPLFSVWANYLRAELSKTIFYPNPSTSKIKRWAYLLLFVIQLFGILSFISMTWNLLLISVQFVVFVFIDILRNADTSLSRIILLLAIFIYVFSAFTDFEDDYRELKSVTIRLCRQRAGAAKEEGTKVVVKHKPHEPLFVKTTDGESSIPRRIFYDICKVYRPYHREVIATFARLALTFTVIFILFYLIAKFQILEDLSDQWETMITIATVALPSMVSMLKSNKHQHLRNQRRDSKICTWLERITTVSKVSLNVNDSIKVVIGEYLFKNNFLPQLEKQ